MRTRRKVATRAVAVGVATTVALMLAGCVPPPPRVIPTSQASGAPVFATDAAALAAAKNAFAGYVAASDEVAHDGGANVSRIQPWVSTSQFTSDTKSFADMQVAGHHTSGASSYSNVALESSGVVDGRAHVVTYICLQIGGTQLLDASEKNVGSNRPLALPLEVSFVSSPAATKKLLVDRSVGWSGTNFCS